MGGLTAEQYRKLIESIKQWGDSQDRIRGEQDHQKALAAAVMDAMQITEKNFKLVAKSYWADTVKKDREDAEAQLEMFEAVRGVDDIKHEVAWIKANGATLECVNPDSIQ